MKKYLFLVMILAISYSAFSQETEKRSTIQTSPLLLLTDLFVFTFAGDDYYSYAVDLEWQTRINNHFNLSLGAEFVYSYDANYIYEESFFLLNLKPMLIWRPFGTGLRGFYLGLHPSVGLVSYNYDGDRKLFTDIGAGIDIGYKWIFRNGLTMQIGSGLGRIIATLPEKPVYYENYSDTMIPFRILGLGLLQFKMGYSF